MQKLISKIFTSIDKSPDNYEAYDDLFALCRNVEKDDFELAHATNAKLRRHIALAMKRKKNIAVFFELYKKTLLFDAPYFFDSYLLYLEINRLPQQRFYQPRRKVLAPLVQGLQDLADDKLDELFLSEPPRVGKTTMLMFYLTWLIGRDSEKSNLYSAYSDTITKAFYNGVLEVLNDPVTYLWHDVFPKSKLADTNVADETLNIDRKKRYPSLTCRSLYGTLNGACDCNGILIADDLLGGIEEALRPERLDGAWSKVDNNLLTRAKNNAKILWCGTRWSIADPIGRRLELLQNDERFKNRRIRVISLPALNENDESNFDYDYGVGYNTEYYIQRRASFEKNGDMPSWFAQYQGAPVERQGVVFSSGDMRFYNGILPEREQDRVFFAVDPAFGGGDFVAGPVCYQYDDDIYVHDVVFNDGDKKVTQPLIAKKIVKNSVSVMRLEANKSTEGYKDGIIEELKKQDYRLRIDTKAASSKQAKHQRIFDKAPDIREHMIFLAPDKRTKEYEQFMQNVFSYKLLGNNQHDDAPDSLAMAMDMVLTPDRKAKIKRRPF